jgi:hypothetical protein
MSKKTPPMVHFSVLVTVDCPPTTSRSEVQKYMTGVEVFRPDGSLVGTVGFAAIPNSTHELARLLLAEPERSVR